MTPEVRWAIIQGDLERQTDLHGRLAVRLLEVGIVYIYGYIELPLFIKSDLVIEEGERGR
jgi:hypothetical protein